MPTNRARFNHNVPAARELRGRETRAEGILWEAIRNRRLNGLKFRRQHPIGPFVVDFCCPDRNLAIELDGGVHAAQAEHDTQREALLAAAGYRVIRFPNEAIYGDLPTVLDANGAAALAEPPRPRTLPRSGAW
jgi:very-short-patch-repair endonuclease